MKRATNVILWSLFGSSVAGACRDVDLGRGAGATCDAQSDCRSPYVCELGTCRSECDVDRDCPGGACLMLDDDTGVCTNGGEGSCRPGDTGACPPGFECGQDGACRNQCDANHPCAGGRLCVSGTCFDEPTDTPTGGAGGESGASSDTGGSASGTAGARPSGGSSSGSGGRGGTSGVGGATSGGGTAGGGGAAGDGAAGDGGNAGDGGTAGGGGSDAGAGGEGGGAGSGGEGAATWTRIGRGVNRGWIGGGYDEGQDRLVVFGGFTAVAPTNDVFVLENASVGSAKSSWTPLATNGTKPLERAGTGIAVYDDVRNRLIVHGGCGGGCSPARADTWVLTNASGVGGSADWSPRASSPIPRAEHSMAYDASNARLMVFGGNSAFFNTARNDVWVMVEDIGAGTASWTELSPTGTRPTERADPAVSYEPSTNRLFVHGGQNGLAARASFDDLWMLSNANGLGGTPVWTEIVPEGPAPSARFLHSMVYDPSAGRLIVYGGQNDSVGATNDVWALPLAGLDPARAHWSPIATTTEAPPLSGHVAAFSAVTNQMLVAGDPESWALSL